MPWIYLGESGEFVDVKFILPCTYSKEFMSFTSSFNS